MPCHAQRKKAWTNTTAAGTSQTTTFSLTTASMNCALRDILRCPELHLQCGQILLLLILHLKLPLRVPLGQLACQLICGNEAMQMRERKESRE